MNIRIQLAACLLMAPVFGYASDCSDLSSAIKLSKTCPPVIKPGDTKANACNLKKSKTYKISQSMGSADAPLPPVTIPATTVLCIANSELSGKIDIYANSFWVDGGVFQIGSAISPITSANKVTITMTGTDSVAPAPQPICASAGKPKKSCSDIAYKSFKTKNARDITVTGSGQLLMYGEKGLTPVVGQSGDYIHSIDYTAGTADGVPIGDDINQVPYFNNVSGSNSWTYLNKPAGPAYFSADLNVQSPIELANYPAKLGNITLTAGDLPYLLSLSRNVSAGNGNDWEVGDWVSVATTTFVAHETEIVQVCKVYNIANPDPQKHTNISVIVLAGSPSFCPTASKNTPLKHYHFGSLAASVGYFPGDTPGHKNKHNASKGQAHSFYDGEDRNFGIDERAEVALLSRNIKLTSTAGSTSTAPLTNIPDQYFGGHIAIMNTAGQDAPTAKVELVGVEIEKFGQPMVGRYPIHFHRMNAHSTTKDSNNLLVQDTVVHHSFNKCFVTHDTMGVNFYNNACVRTIGQGFYLEDGHNIAGNQYVHNLVAGTMAASLKYDVTAATVKNEGGVVIGKNTYWDGDNLATTAFGYNPAKIPDTSDSGANTGNFIDSFEPSGFWITTFGNRINHIDNPNIFVNNSVAGCQMRGAAYWAILQDVKDIGDVPSITKPTLYPVFSGNRGHACYDGFIAGDNSMVQATPAVAIGPQPLPVPVGEKVSTSANTPFVVFDNLNFTQIEHKAFWYRGVFVGVNNSRFAALKQGMTLLGGGGPEGNLLGFWGLVHNSVYAGVTNNNVGRYSDCEGYYKTYGSSGATSLTNNQALPLETTNEMVKCVPVDLTAVSTVTDITNNDTSLYGDIYPQFNFQGYTFYDGPARMENNRFVNFRADVTNSSVYENDSDSYSTSDKRHLVTVVDAHRMMNFNKASQLSTGYTSGGNQHYGVMGDAAFSWLKGNAQSVPPTQYAKANLWDNVNYKHQIFTEIANLSAGLKDGDKQTVEIDRDATLSGYKLCQTYGQNGGPVSCSDTSLNHYPISLNNLNIFATKSTVDEPHSQGRNNVVSSALMSPHKYATVNVGVGGQGSITNLNISRNMKAYNGEEAKTTYTGRGGKTYMYESMAMNNMGYTYSSDNLSGQTEFLFSYSDAPVDTTFINRVGFNIGKNAQNIVITKVPRQWNAGQNYLAISPYWETKYGLTNASTCPTVMNVPTAYNTCKTNGMTLNTFTSFSELNSKFFTVLENNYKGNATAKGDVTEGYYYDSCTGVLYFNMIQFAEATTSTPPPIIPTITPPYGTCDSAAYNTPVASGNKKQIQDYLKFSNSESVASILDVGCYVEAGTPKTSELLTCPPEGCAVYTVGFDNGASNSAASCTASSTPEIIDGGISTPVLKASSITYGSPYILYDASEKTTLVLSKGSVTVNYGGGELTRSYHYVPKATPTPAPTPTPTPGSGPAPASGPTPALLPMPPSPSSENGATYTLDSSPTGISVIAYGQKVPASGQIWTFNTGASFTAGQYASVSTSGSKKLNETNPAEKTVDKISIKPSNGKNSAKFRYQGATAKVTVAGNDTCIINFTSSSLSKGTESGCAKVTSSGTTITISAPQIWTFNTGASATAGQIASIRNSGAEKLYETNSTHKAVDTISIEPDKSSNSVNFIYAGATATVTVAEDTCTINFTTSNLSKGAGSGCNKMTASGTTIIVGAP